MSSLDNQKILFCVSGGPAAYQLPELVAALVERNAQVTLLMSADTGNWVSLLLLEKLGANLMVEPATAVNELDRFDTRIILLSDPDDGAGDGTGEPWLKTLLVCLIEAQHDWSGTVCLGSSSELERFLPESQTGLIKETGVLIPPLLGDTRLPKFDPFAIIAAVVRSRAAQLLVGKRVLVTAGPTFEDIDPVRFIGNRSSGKMGYAVAAAAWQAGAEVTLVTGPVARPTPQGVAVIRARSAIDMQAAVDGMIDGQDIYISSAAVADYRPEQTQPHKIKKGSSPTSLSLVANPDLLARVAARPSPPFCVGFAAETEQLEEYARGKLVNKKLQMIAANLVGDADGGFESDQNHLHLYWPGGERQLPRSSKAEQARQLIGAIAERFNDWNGCEETGHGE